MHVDLYMFISPANGTQDEHNVDTKYLQNLRSSVSEHIFALPFHWNSNALRMTIMTFNKNIFCKQGFLNVYNFCEEQYE